MAHAELEKLSNAIAEAPEHVRAAAIRAAVAAGMAVVGEGIGQADDRPPLNETSRLIYEILSDLEPHDAMSSEQLVAELEALGKSPNASTLRTRHLGRNAPLRAWGLKSSPGGYRIGTAPQQASDDKPALSERAGLILETLLELPPHQRMTSLQLAEQLRMLGRPCDPYDIRRRYISELEPYGVERTAKGYRLPASRRPVAQ